MGKILVETKYGKRETERMIRLIEEWDMM